MKKKYVATSVLLHVIQNSFNYLTTQITGGLYTKEDGHVDPYSLTQAYAVGARLHGAEVFLNSPVTALKQRSDGGWDVQTDQGTINAKMVVNCAGKWIRVFLLDLGELLSRENFTYYVHKIVFFILYAR